LRAVADTSSLIHPAKVPRFWNMMRETFEKLLIPGAVHAEILKGRGVGSPDVPVIENAIDQGWIEVRKIRKERALPDNLGEGEKEAISLMKKEKGKVDWLLIDDEVASRTARLLFGLAVHSTVYLLIYWREKGLLEPAQALIMLDELVQTGYRLNSRDYLAVRERITRIAVS
jgi:predicted nucleic acid-binding protein